MSPPRYSARELSQETWNDFDRFFRKPGEWSSCQCMWFHRQGPRPKEDEALTSKGRNEKNFREQKNLVKSGRSHGMLVYLDDDPVGWCQYGPGEEFPRIDNAARYRGIPAASEGKRLWRITCFCVDKRQRRRGIAKFGLRAAMDSIRKKGGGTVEAYPSTRNEGLALHRGTASMFKEAGFEVVGPLGPNNFVVRKKV